VPGKVVGPSFSAAEVPDVIEAVLDTYRSLRQSAGEKAETFIATLQRTGIDPFKTAANAARRAPRTVTATAADVTNA
jgi:sulfite reductase (NADPH) hemoprotein beta-component